MDELEDPKKQSLGDALAVTDDTVEQEVVQHLNNPVVGLKPIVKKYLGSVQKVTQDDNKFYF